MRIFYKRLCTGLQHGLRCASSTSTRPSTSLGLLFPGQGTQHVGMGRDLADNFAEAREVFERTDEALQLHLSRLMFGTDPRTGADPGRLTLTENAQPAIVAHAMAMLAVLRQRQGLRVAEGDGASVDDADPDAARACAVLLGHSVGEYAALVAGGSMSLEDAVRVVQARGRAMQACVGVGGGQPFAMVAVMPCSAAGAEAMCAAGSETTGLTCGVANINSSKQSVLSGAAAAVDAAVAHGRKERLCRRAVPLTVSAPFHCELMRPAADAVQRALANAAVVAPAVTVVSNVTAAPYGDGDEGSETAKSIRDLLARQVWSTVRWHESVRASGPLEATDTGSSNQASTHASASDAEEGVRVRDDAEGETETRPRAARFLEVGPGTVLTSLMRGDPHTKTWPCHAVGTAAGVDDAGKWLAETR